MKTSKLLFVVAAVHALFIVGFSAVARFPITLTDGAGNTVTIVSEPQRIVSLAPSHTEILYVLGLQDRIVGVTTYCNYPPAAAEKVKVGEFANISLEQVVGLEPNLVLGTSMHAAEVAPRLRELDIAVFIVDSQTVLEVLTDIQTIGRITGREEVAADLVAKMRNRIEAVQTAVEGEPRPRVFWELGPELYTAGPGSWINDLIELAGGENIADDVGTPWPQLSVEVIVLKDPDVVVLADHNYGETAEKVAERPGWSDIAAVKVGRVIELVEEDIFSRPGPRIVDALEFMARALHPERFAGDEDPP